MSLTAWLAGLLVCSGVLVPTLTVAAAVIVYDSGRTEPLAPYFEALLAGEREAAPQASPAVPQPLRAFQIAFPIHTPEMRPGQAPRRALPALPAPLTRAFFLVGTDAYSRQWLAARRPELERLGAVGMVVEVATPDDLLALRRIAGALQLSPASASDIARVLGLDVYPVLVTQQGIGP